MLVPSLLLGLIAKSSAETPFPTLGTVSVNEPVLPSEWHVLEYSVPENQLVNIQIVLKSSNLEKLPALVQSVSDPKSASYGRYWSTAEINEFTAPDPAHVRAVEEWLVENGIPFQRADTSASIDISVTADVASKLLHTQFYHAKNWFTGKLITRATTYQLPPPVHQAISAVYGLHGLPLPPKTGLRPKMPANVTPSVISTTYDVKGVQPSGSTNVRQAVAEFQGQATNPQDIEKFFKQFLPGTEVSKAQIYKFVGDPGKGSEGVEAGLDIEFIMGVAPGLLTEFWYWKGNDFCADLKNWTNTILNTENPPLVHSVSYGWQGDLHQVGCSDDKVQDVDANFQKLALKGISIIFASGDSGSGYTPPNQCPVSGASVPDTAIEGTLLHNFSGPPSETACCQIAQGNPWTIIPSSGQTPAMCSVYKDVARKYHKAGVKSGGPGVAPIKNVTMKLYPSWPASSPFVTSVGGTRFVDQTVGEPEMATDQFGSGGGFSTMFKALPEQVDFVKQYLASAPQLPPVGSFPVDGRATPDVAGIAEGYQVFVNGQVQSIGGTSASTPMFAGLVSLLNEARIKAGKPAMGYLNPWLYKNTDMFTDVTLGDNAYGRGPFRTPYGFNATKGWDPVTGLGTPIFSKMLKVALAEDVIVI